MSQTQHQTLDSLRCTSAYLLANAITELFPEAKPATGALTEHGFYYDFERDDAFTPEDFSIIEQQMANILSRDEQLVSEMWTRDAVEQHFKTPLNRYMLERIANQTEHANIQMVRCGNFVDFSLIANQVLISETPPVFKLLKVAGAYWQGDATQPMLQRIYGTAWSTQQALKNHLLALEEAEKRDHRRLGREMDLFHFEDNAPGAVFWHPKGWQLFQQLIGYMRQQQADAGYVEVNTPDVMDRGLWEVSGHWQNYRDHMFTTQTEDARVFALKPMSCPGAVLLYKHSLKSYRDLPIRMAEFGKVHRYEPSGALHGLMRVRHFTQDDAHIFCTSEQLLTECQAVIALVLNIYKQFGFENIAIKLSTRPQNKIGDDAVWDQLEQALANSLDHFGLAYSINDGEGAFYGPKLEFVLRDAIGRDWQCGTLQVDLNLPERFDIHYINETGERVRPVMLHRALFGSLERFTGILLEHYAGRLPFWLAPLQVVVTSITNDFDDYARHVVAQCKAVGIKVELDTRNEKVGYKIRAHTTAKVPLLIAVGGREAQDGSVAIRWLATNSQEVLPLTDAINNLSKQLKPPHVE